MNGSPSPPPALEPQGFFSGIRPFAVAIGALVDQVSTMILGLLMFGIIAAGYGKGAGEPLGEEAIEALSRDPEVMGAWMLLGSFCTGLGGFMAARLAPTHAIQHGAFVGLVGIAVGLLSYGSDPSMPPAPLWYDLASFGVLVPVGALGGWVAGRHARPPARQTDDSTEPPDGMF